MSELRKQQLLARIAKVASNDPEAPNDTISDIKVSRSNNANGDIEIDFVAHFMKTNEQEPDRMTVSYAAAKSIIKNPYEQHKVKVNLLLQKIIQSSLRGMDTPGGDQERAAIQ